MSDVTLSQIKKWKTDPDLNKDLHGDDVARRATPGNPTNEDSRTLMAAIRALVQSIMYGEFYDPDTIDVTSEGKARAKGSIETRDLATILGMSNPSQKTEIQNYLGIRDDNLSWQSACYDSKRNRFVIGCASFSGDTSPGKLFALTDLNDPSTLAATNASAAGGHFNDLAYDPVNDVIYIAPGDKTGHTKKIHIADPATLVITGSWDVDFDVWQCDVWDGYLYVFKTGVGIIRYSLADRALDESFTPLPVVRPVVADGEKWTANGMFICNGILVMAYVITHATLSICNKRAAFVCHSLSTGLQVTTSFKLTSSEEFEGGVARGTTLYVFAQRGRYKNTVYVVPTDTIYMTDRYSGGRLPSGTDLDKVLADGAYYIHGTAAYESFLNAPPLLYKSPGTLFVFDAGVSGTKVQIIFLTNGNCRWRIVNIENGSTTNWRGIALHNGSQMSLSPIVRIDFDEDTATSADRTDPNPGPYTIDLSGQTVDMALIRVYTPDTASSSKVGYFNVYFGNYVRLRTKVNNVVKSGAVRNTYVKTERGNAMSFLRYWGGGASGDLTSDVDGVSFNSTNWDMETETLVTSSLPLFVVDSALVKKVEFWLSEDGVIPAGTYIEIYGTLGNTPVEDTEPEDAGDEEGEVA